jgi:hypothetical protein
MKFNLLIILAVFFVLPLVSGTNSLESSGSWSNWQNSEAGTGLSQIFMDFPSQVTTSSTIYGSNFEPLIADFDADGINEVVVSSGYYLFAYSLSGGSILPEAQQIISGIQNTSGAVFYSDLDGKLEFGIPSGIHVLLFSYNGSAFKNEHNLTSVNGNISTNFLCVSDYGSQGDYCFFMSIHGVFQNYNAKTGVEQNLTVTTSCKKAVAAPLLKPKMVFSSNFNGYSVAVSCVAEGKVWIIHPTTLVSDGAITTGSYPHNLMFYNYDGYLYEELFIALTVSGANPSSYIKVYDSVGTLLHYVSDIGGGDNGNVPCVSFAAGHFTGMNKRQIVASSSYSATIKVYDLNVSVMSVAYSFTHSLSPFWTNLVSIDSDQDGYSDVITPWQLIKPHTSFYFNWSINSGGYMVVGDVNADGNAEVISSASGKTWVDSSNIAVSGSNVSGVVISTNGKDLARMFSNPVCIGTMQYFYAYDCQNKSFSGVCQYVTNNNLTREALYTGCGRTVLPLYTGGFSKDMPTVQCFMNRTGQAHVKLYLVTESDVTDFSHAFDVVVDVVNLTDFQGLNCNVEPYVPHVPIVTTNLSEQAAQEQSIYDLLTFGRTLAGIIAGCLIMLLCLFGTIFLCGKTNSDPQIVGIAVFFVEFLALAILTYYGLMPAWVLVSLLVISAAVIGLTVMGLFKPQASR